MRDVGVAGSVDVGPGLHGPGRLDRLAEAVRGELRGDGFGDSQHLRSVGSTPGLQIAGGVPAPGIGRLDGGMLAAAVENGGVEPGVTRLGIGQHDSRDWRCKQATDSDFHRHGATPRLNLGADERASTVLLSSGLVDDDQSATGRCASRRRRRKRRPDLDYVHFWTVVQCFPRQKVRRSLVVGFLVLPMMVAPGDLARRGSQWHGRGGEAES